ncbi:hypothetical protein AAC387_Pa02g1821 [Persea americana]
MPNTPFLLLLLYCLAALLARADAAYMGYNTTHGIVPGKINVHLVAHTHDDVGWLKTVDQYYVGANNSIQGASVENVLDSVVTALSMDKNRKFIYVEQAFFQRWWRQQSSRVQSIVKKLVNSGQLEFINGGMCMHDEAATHYIDMIDQTTLGHRFIKQEFGKTPRIGWQIDPFGHSAVQAYLLGAEVGFDSLFYGRIDYQDREKRKDDKTLEVVWQGSNTLGSSSQIFAGAFPDGYGPPDGFSFEVNDESPIVQDNILLFDYNVQERVNDFVAAAISQGNITRTNHVMWTMGTDFTYQYANSWFRQMDKLIHFVNEDGRVNALYSTPSIYTDAKYAANESWPLKTDDFFPYAERVNAYYTGYFTSRAAIKGYVRAMSAYYLAARQLEFLKNTNSSGPKTDTLADALALVQHHDGVSGTEKQHVADDYAKRLSIGYVEAAELVESSLACLTESKSKSGCQNLATKFDQCPLLNISYCPPSELDLSHGKSLVIVVYNSLAWKRVEIVRIPVINESVIVLDSEGKEIESQLLPISNASVGLRNYYVRAYTGITPSDTPNFWLTFSATAPPFGFSTYIVSGAEHTGASSFMSTFHASPGDQNGTIEVGQGNLRLVYAVKEGKLTRYFNSRSMVKAFIEQSYKFYSGDDGSGNDPQGSGAYIFRPNGTFPIKSDGQEPMTVLRGPVLDEVHQSINPWISQVGPIPIDDGIGKELATQITTTMITSKTFYTDSNGRDFIKRVRDYRSDWNLQVNQPVAGNYYPINLGIYMEDSQKELSVMVDRAIGGSSILDGQIELMLHRRLLHDSGIGEALNETVCVSGVCQGLTVQGKFYLRIDPLGEGAKWRRMVGQEIYTPFLLAFSEQNGGNWMSSHIPTFSAMDPSYSLPDNVAMITLQVLEDGSVLMRLAHLYEMGEDKDLSVMAYVDLRKLFPDKTISKITEMNLSANQERVEMEKKRLIWKVEGPPKEEMKVKGGPVDPSKLVAELGPMEIRTFILVFQA